MDDRILRNPFYVLELPPCCSRAEVERQGQKLLGMLELGLSAARTYRTPVGTPVATMERTAEGVRQAMAELRDPQRRLVHELWAHLPVEQVSPAEDQAAGDGTSGDRLKDPADRAAHGVAESDGLAPWIGALQALGFGPRGGT